MSIEFKVPSYKRSYEAAKAELEDARANQKKALAEYNAARLSLAEAICELMELLTPEEFEEYKQNNPELFPSADNVIEFKP